MNEITNEQVEKKKKELEDLVNADFAASDMNSWLPSDADRSQYQNSAAFSKNGSKYYILVLWDQNGFKKSVFILDREVSMEYLGVKPSEENIRLISSNLFPKAKQELEKADNIEQKKKFDQYSAVMDGWNK